jgi:hypothetical protein
MLAANPTEESFMAEKVKATKAPAKPRKATAKKKAAPEAPKAAMPSREEIEQLARKYWASRGYTDGYAEQDWLQAEHELRKMAS